ncbi:MAG: hypothetical protein V4722_03825 [Bacteroidota bacterium]
MVTLPGLLAMLILVIAACTSIRKRPALKTGDICTIEESNGWFGVVKVLKIDTDRIHVKMYQDKFYSRPEMIDPASLSMGDIAYDESGITMAHLPYQKPEFNALKPEVEANEIVQPEELDAYRVWKRQ